MGPLWLYILITIAPTIGLLALFGLSAFALYRMATRAVRGSGASTMSFGDAVIMWALVSIVWWSIASGFHIHRAALLIAAALFAGTLGIFLGFLITAFGDENHSAVGKTRDWLFGGLTGLTLGGILTNRQHIADFFALFVTDGLLIGVQIGNIALFAMLGFFAMFWLRESIWNLRLADARRRLKAMLERQTLTPPDAPPAPEGQPAAAATSAVPAEFARGTPTPPEAPAVAAQSARVIEKLQNAAIPSSELGTQERLGLATALINTGRFKQATELLESMLSKQESVEQAVQLLSLAADRASDDATLHEKAANALLRFPTSLPYAEHLAAYHLLWVPTRLTDAITIGQNYLEKHPDSSSTLFNIACAYAQLFARHRTPPEADAALANLRAAIAKEPRWGDRARQLSLATDGDFYALANDVQYGNTFRQVASATPGW